MQNGCRAYAIVFRLSEICELSLKHIKTINLCNKKRGAKDNLGEKLFDDR